MEPSNILLAAPVLSTNDLLPEITLVGCPQYEAEKTTDEALKKQRYIETHTFIFSPSTPLYCHCYEVLLTPEHLVMLTPSSFIVVKYLQVTQFNALH